MKEVDPNFMKACSEIEHVLKKYNMGAIVYLASDKGTHFYHALHLPAWSCIKIEEQTDRGAALRVKASSKNPEDRNKLELTVNMLGFFGDMMINSAGSLKELEYQIGRKVEIDRRNHIGKEPDWYPA